MRIDNLKVENFKGLKSCELILNGQSVLLCGSSASGKTSVLEAVCFLCWNWLHRLNPAQSTAFRCLDESWIKAGTAGLSISVQFDTDGKSLLLKKECTRGRTKKEAAAEAHKQLSDAFVQRFLELHGKEGTSLPVFAYYSVARSVSKIPLRARNNHPFSRWSALEQAAEKEQDFSAFFEWLRNQEDYEAEMIREKRDLIWKDPALECVRKAVYIMLPELSNLKVKRSSLQLTVKKNGEEITVNHLSDTEKSLLALTGDIARRLALANQNRSDPLQGEGIVLIDEIELHLDSVWQGRVLPSLLEIFPNIQFVLTTQSAQVLEKAGEKVCVIRLPDKNVE